MKFILFPLAVMSFGQTAMAKSQNPLLSELSLGVREHPIGKVINLLEELKTKVQEEGEAEEESYQKFKNWCENSQKKLSEQINKEEEKIEELTQSISAKEELISSLESDLEFLTKQLEEQSVSGKDADKIREETAKAYDEGQKDFEDTIKAVEECITALEDAKSSTSLLLAKSSVRKVLALAEGLVSEKDGQML